MGYASRAGRARTSAKRPRAFAVCDRCGIWYNRDQLNFQYDWRGTALQNLYILVCNRCLDRPQEQLRAITLPADPVPVYFPRPENFDAASTNYRKASTPVTFDPKTGLPNPSPDFRVTMNCQNRVTQPFGRPEGMNINGVMPYNSQDMKKYGVPLPVLSVTSDGTNIITFTCYAVHGLQPCNQVGITGLLNSAADGFYSVGVPTATQFQYATYDPVPAASLWDPSAAARNLRIGLPRGFTVIPKIFGPPSSPYLGQTCYFELENGSGIILLENGGYLTLEQCTGVPVAILGTCETGVLQLENGDFVSIGACSG